MEDSIPAVVIMAYREQAYMAGPNMYTTDSMQLQIFGRSNVGDLLQRTAPVLINNYGSGNASISIRGTNDDHTLVLWNGIPLNSITLGSMDISLLSVESAPNISVVTNAGSNVFGSGSFGGVVLLDDDDARWRKQTHISLRTDLSSFNSYRTSLGMQSGNENFQFRSNSFYQNAQNDFTYTDVYKFLQPILKMSHNALQQSGSVNTLRWKIDPKNILQAGNWFQWKEKDIPNIMGSNQPSSKFQQDAASRSYIKYNHLFRNAQLQLSSAHIYDFLAYSDKLAPTDTFLFINSSIKANRSLNSLSYRHYFRSVELDAAADLNFVRADVSEYGKKIREFQGAVFAGMNYTYKNLKLNASVRQEFRPGKYIRPMFGFHALISSKNKIYQAGISYSDKYHAPDFNDKYWTPGGNQGLLPEKGFTTELSQQLRVVRNLQNEVEFRLNFYLSRIKDEIIWQPVSGLVWSPENLQAALHYGTEFQLQYRRNLSNGSFQFQLLYLFNRSVILNNDKDNSIAGNIMVYKPQHNIKSVLQYQNQYFSGGVNYIFTGKRYTDNENIDVFALDGYGLLDLFAGFSIPVKTLTVDVLVRIENVLNTSYQSVRSYAQPGRSLTLSIILNLNKSSKNEN